MMYTQGMSSAAAIFDRLLQIALLIQDDMARYFADTALTPARTHLLWELNRLGPSTQQALARHSKSVHAISPGWSTLWRPRAS